MEKGTKIVRSELEKRFRKRDRKITSASDFSLRGNAIRARAHHCIREACRGFFDVRKMPQSKRSEKMSIRVGGERVRKEPKIKKGGKSQRRRSTA